jgi:dTDP-4-dehydrorhamnose 3,5-epimerase-like enzyme
MKIKTKFSGLISPQSILDSKDGTLNIVEEKSFFPFKIKRLYYINNFDSNTNSVRGRHAHRQLTQAITCLSGSFTLKIDDGDMQQKLKLNSILNKFILLGPGLWHEMSNISKDCVILVLASDSYDESDYIRSYDDFLNWTKINED